MNKQDLIEKSNDKEKVLLAKVLDKIELSKSKNKIESTDFLDQHEQKIILDMLQKIKAKNYIFFGGIENSERKILIIYPEKLSELFKNDIPNKDEYITTLRITLPKELQGKYNHRDYLGGIIKIGVKREKVGDIIVYPEGADILTIPEVNKYLQYNLSDLIRFSKSTIELEKLENIKEKEEKFEEFEIIVPSMRLDAITAELIRISRSKSADLIKEERVFINFVLEPRTSKEVKLGDLITIRGKGRFKIVEAVRKTKSNREVLRVQKYV